MKRISGFAGDIYMDEFVAPKSRTMRAFYIGRMPRQQFVRKAGVGESQFARVEDFLSHLTFEHAQRLAQASGGDAKEIWYNHMFEDLKYQLANNTWVDVFKRIAKYAGELAKPECPLSVEEKRALIDSFRDMVSIPTPNTPVPTEEDIEAIKAKTYGRNQMWSDRLHEEQIKNEQDFYDRLRQDAQNAQNERDSLGRNRPRLNLERDNTGRRRR